MSMYVYMSICMWKQCLEEVRKFGIKLQKAESHSRQVGALAGQCSPATPGALESTYRRPTAIPISRQSEQKSISLTSKSNHSNIILHSPVPLRSRLRTLLTLGLHNSRQKMAISEAHDSINSRSAMAFLTTQVHLSFRLQNSKLGSFSVCIHDSLHSF